MRTRADCLALGALLERGAMAELTVILVSFNTRQLTLKALETLFANAGRVAMDVIVWDNASHDGSADAVAQAFPQVTLVRSAKNIGFGAAHNALTGRIETDHLLLLNSDTETLPGAIAALRDFARANPQAGIVGGRTLFADGSLNPSSCWNRMTPWSLFCSATGLTRLFRQSALFNPEGIGGWPRDSVAEVDIVSGCFLLIRTDLWRALGGFSPRYFMYGEDADLCLRAKAMGYQPMITPAAQIVHLGGGSVTQREEKMVQLLRAKASLIRDHWSTPAQPLGLALLWLWSAARRIGSQASGNGDAALWRNLWQRRRDWLLGYGG